MQATVCTEGQQELAGALYAVVVRLSRLRVDEPLDKAGLAVLHEARQLGSMFRPSDLATQMQLDLSTISRHLRSLELQGMVQRSADPHDARAQRISITGLGLEVLKRMMDHRAATIRDAVAQWPEADRDALGRLLRRLADDLPGALAPAMPGASPTNERTEKS